MSKRIKKIFKILLSIIIGALILTSSSYFIYAATVEKTTITCTDIKMFEALSNSLEKYILLGDANSSDLTIKIPTENISDIIEINLENKDISDITGIEKLTSLKKINLAKNKILDITPLNELTEITDLNLNENGRKDTNVFLGSSESLENVLSSKTSLVKLNLSGIGLSDISFLSRLNNLKELYMASASFHDLHDISNLSGLTTLDVSENKSLISIETVLNFYNLKVLNISNTGITTLELNDNNGIYNLENLEELYVRGLETSPLPIVKTYYTDYAYKDENGEWVGDNLTYLENLKKLDIGYMNKNERVEMINFRDLTVLSNLEVLYMQGNHITDVDGCYELENLKEINLAENDISSINDFVHNETKYDEDGNEYIETKGLTATIIDLHDNYITDISVFYGLPKRNQIKSLDLQKNHIYNVGAIESIGTNGAYIRLQDQLIDMSIFYKKINLSQYIILLPIMQQAKNPNSIVYAENAVYNTKGCTLNQDEDYQKVGSYNVIIDHKWEPEDTEENPQAAENITVTLNGGIADGSKIRFIISDSSDSIDSLRFNDPRLTSAIRDNLMSRENAEYVISAEKILNCNNILIEETEKLDLSNYGITDITGLENFFNLKDLNISKNKGIKTIEPIRTCDQMMILDASETSIENKYSVIENMKELNTLILNNTGMTNINSINNLTNKILNESEYEDEETRLEVLDLSSNKIDNIAGVEKITSLRTLTISNALLEKVPSLKTLTKLENLSMYSNKLNEVPELKGLENLQYVQLSNNRITDISNLALINCNLIELDLSNNIIGDEAFSKIANVRVRRKLNVSGNLISDITPLNTYIGTLQELDVSKNCISDVSLIDRKFSKNSTFYASNQRIAVTADSGENDILTVTLPPIFDSAKQSSSMIYTSSDFNVQNCTVSGNTVTVDLKELGDKAATVQIIGGKADRTTLSILYPIKTKITYSTEELTAENVIATIEFTNRTHVTITNNEGSDKHTFEDNGEFTFTYVDDYGMTGETKAEVTWMDKKAPTLSVKYSTTQKTKDSIVVTMVSDEEVQNVEGWNLSSDKKTLTKTYTDNVDENVIVKDLLGNEATQKIVINNIDRKSPVLEVEYSETESTTEPVTVTITADEEVQEVEGWELSDNKKVLTKTYRKNTDKNGEIIKVKDLLGNESEKTIIVTNIEVEIEEVSIESEKYEVGDSVISHINPNTTASEMLDNMTIVASDIKIYNSKDEEVNDSDIVGTGMRIVLNDEYEYTFVVKGDTNGDGKSAIQDLLMLNKHRLNKSILEGIYFEAGDVNEDNIIDVKDLLLINKARLGKTSL